MLELLRERARERGTSVLFITHDLAVVAQLCNRVYVMYAGRIVEQGATAAVLRHPLHPYTSALLRSLPEAAVPKQPLAAIPGTAASPADALAGCAFRPRCRFAYEPCTRLPPLFPGRAGPDPARRLLAGRRDRGGPCSRGGTRGRDRGPGSRSRRPRRCCSSAGWRCAFPPRSIGWAARKPMSMR